MLIQRKWGPALVEGRGTGSFGQEADWVCDYQMARSRPGKFSHNRGEFRDEVAQTALMFID
jgi:hypothetical protein